MQIVGDLVMFYFVTQVLAGIWLRVQNLDYQEEKHCFYGNMYEKKRILWFAVHPLFFFLLIIPLGLIVAGLKGEASNYSAMMVVVMFVLLIAHRIVVEEAMVRNGYFVHGRKTKNK